MTSGPMSWFASRTAREQLLLMLTGIVIVAGGLLMTGWQAASTYRATAAADLASALQLRDDITRLKAFAGSTGAAPVPANDGSVRGIVVAVASHAGLSPASIEPDGPTGIRTAFNSANAQSVFQWVDAVERAGLSVTRITLVRADEGDIVQASATIASR